jgi:hypothetical protein
LHDRPCGSSIGVKVVNLVVVSFPSSCCCVLANTYIHDEVRGMSMVSRKGVRGIEVRCVGKRCDVWSVVVVRCDQLGKARHGLQGNVMVIN